MLFCFLFETNNFYNGFWVKKKNLLFYCFLTCSSIICASFKLSLNVCWLVHIFIVNIYIFNYLYGYIYLFEFLKGKCCVNFQLVFNSFTNGVWGKEEKQKNPFKKGAAYDIRIRSHDSKFTIYCDRVITATICSGWMF